MSAIELLRDELTLSPERAARMVRITALVALVVTVSMALRVPDAAVSAYMIFFFAQRDVATTVTTAVGGIVGMTMAIALCFVCLLVATAEPAARLPLMVLLAFTGMHLMRATPLGPLGLLLGFVTFYPLTYADQLPLPEALVRALLWLWVVIAYPVGLLVLSDLVFGARPEAVYRSGVAARLAAAADYLVTPAERDAEARARLLRSVRLGASDLVPYVDRGGPAATAPIRATLLRQSELLGHLLRELPDDVRRNASIRPVLERAGAACDGARKVLLSHDGETNIRFELLDPEQHAVAAMAPVA